MMLMIGIVLAILAQIGAPAAQDYGFEPATCPFGNATNYQIDCGYVTVPANHAEPENGNIRLAVAVVRSPNPQPDPVVFLAGGPGDSAVMRAPLTAISYGKLLKSRDLIIFDQRGAGLSRPTLDCPQIGSMLLADSAEFEVMLGAVRACSHEIENEMTEMFVFNTQQSASDIPLLISALGYSSANLLGISYGTRLGLTVLNEHPALIRSAVLDSVTPLQINVYEYLPSGFDRAIGEVEGLCQEDFACRLAYPNLRERFYELYNSLSAQPARIQADDQQTQHQITGQLLSQYVLMSLYQRETVSTLPSTLSEFEVSNYHSILEWLTSMSRNAGGHGLGMLFAVMCSDQGSRTTPERVQALDAQYHPALSPDFALYGVGGATLCQDWDSSYTTPGQDSPAVSDVPTLLLSGQFDPVTPPAWAYLASETLRNSVVIEQANTGHGVTATQCGLDLAAAYFDDPTRSPALVCTVPALVFELSEHVTRPVIVLMTVVLGAISLWGGGLAFFAVIQHPRYVSWSHVAKELNLYWMLGSLALIMALLGASGSLKAFLNLEPEVVIGLAIPLIVGLQSALLFSPQDEPALEVIAACPRGVSWLILERWVGVCLGQFVFALAALIVSYLLVPGQDLTIMVARWLPPAVLFSGLAIFITIRSRVAAFGLVMTTVLWFIFVGFGDLLLPGALPLFFPLNYIQPFLWGIHPYVQPNDLSEMGYWINRLCVSALGLALIFSAVDGLRDEEQLLFDGHKH